MPKNQLEARKTKGFKLRKKRILVTGAAGFIATALWYRLKDRYDFIGIDKFTYASHKDSRSKESNWGVGRVYCGDAASFHDMSSIINYDGPFDAILAMAAETHNDDSMANPSLFFQNNVMAVQNTLEVVRSIKNRGFYKPPRVYLFSTDETLLHETPTQGSPTWSGGAHHKEHNGWSFYRYPEREFNSSFFNASSPYSASKLCGEVVAQAYKTAYDLPITIIRPSNVYGPLQHPQKLISKTITNVLQGKKVPIYDTGANFFRDYTYVTDTVDAVDLVMQQENPKDLYHIAANQERQNIDTVKTILHLMGASEDMIEYIKDPRGKSHDPCYSLSCDNIKELGWAPKVSFEDGIKETISYFRDHYNCV